MNRVRAAHQYTDSLRSSFDLLKKELEMNQINSESLLDAEHGIKAIGNQSSEYRSDVSQSKILIQKLERRDMMDKILVSLGLLFFLAVVLLIVKNRVGLRIYYFVSWFSFLLPTSFFQSSSENSNQLPQFPAPANIEL